MAGFGEDITLVTTTQTHPLGYKVVRPAQLGGTRANQGEQVWVYVFNDEATNAFAAGEVVIRDPSAATEDWFGAIRAPVTNPVPQIAVIGVAQHAIAAGSFGFVLQRGIGLVLTGTAAVTLDTPFTTGGDSVGTVIDYAEGDTAAATNQANIAVIGHAATAILASVTGTAFIDCGV